MRIVGVVINWPGSTLFAVVLSAWFLHFFSLFLYVLFGFLEDTPNQTIEELKKLYYKSYSDTKTEMILILLVFHCILNMWNVWTFFYRIVWFFLWSVVVFISAAGLPSFFKRITGIYSCSWTRKAVAHLTLKSFHITKSLTNCVRNLRFISNLRNGTLRTSACLPTMLLEHQ